MSIDITLSRPAVEYLDAVRDGLSDLDEDDRDAIVRELEAHLGELGDQDPTEALGDPEAFVAEFRYSAGLEERSEPGRIRRLAAFGRRAMRRLSEHPVTAPFHRHRADLRTVWVWTRAWILVSAVWWLTAYWAGTSLTFGIPWSDSGDTLPGVVLVAVATAGSVWLAGHRRDRFRGRVDRAVTAATVVLIGLAWLNPVWIDDPDESEWYMSEPSWTNIYAYDRAGEPVDVLLYDQDGQALDVSGFDTGDFNQVGSVFYDQWGPLRYEIDRYGQPITNLYPLERLAEDRNANTGEPEYEPVPPPRVGIPEFPETATGEQGSSVDDPAPVVRPEGESTVTTLSTRDRGD